jgi:hypothetical protein
MTLTTAYALDSSTEGKVKVLKVIHSATLCGVSNFPDGALAQRRADGVHSSDRSGCWTGRNRLRRGCALYARYGLSRGRVPLRHLPAALTTSLRFCDTRCV